MSDNVIELVTPAVVKDIPRVLRSIADEMEAGKYGEVEALCVVLEASDGSVRTFGAGQAEYYRAVALFHLGIENLMAKRGRDAML